jgi:hypothetical protein
MFDCPSASIPSPPLPALLSLSSSSVRTQKIRKSVSESNYPRFKNEGEKKEAS